MLQLTKPTLCSDRQQTVVPFICLLLFLILPPSADAENPWTNIGPFDVGVRDFVIDPLNPSIFYATSTAGVWKSEDSGMTWTEANEGLESPGIRPAHLVIDPLNPNNLYLAGSVSILRSTDGAETWQTTECHFVRLITALEIDPNHPTTVFVGLYRGGVFRTIDECDTRLQVHPRSFRIDDLIVDPTNSDNVYSRDSFDFSISNDGGDTWASVRAFDLGVSFFDSAAIAPSSPAILYLGGRDGSLFRSFDGGATWVPRAGLGLPGVAVEELLVHPEKPNTLFAALAPEGIRPKILYRSIDGGESWWPLPLGLNNSQLQKLMIDPQNSSRLYAVTTGGISWIDLTTKFTLQDNRFEAEIEWQDFAGIRGAADAVRIAEVPGQNVALRSRDSAMLEFFAPDNWEMLVKILDGRALNNHFWIFAGAATDVEYTLTVTDTSCGNQWTKHNPLGHSAPAVTETQALPNCAEPMPASCVADEGTLCLGDDGRFAVRLDWRDFGGQVGTGREVLVSEGGIASSEDSGLFYFFYRDNWEFLVKVLDGCGFNNHYWVFAAGATDVGYTLRVTDTLTGETQEYTNPLGNAAPALTDIGAFACP